jgi:hypothetical protein
MIRGKHIIYAVAVICLIFLIFFSIVGNSVGVTYVAEATNQLTAYESNNIIDDLTDSIIGGNKFNLNDYPYNSSGKVQLINLVEFGYSQSSDSDYGLYIYIYNPSGNFIDENSIRNNIQLSFGEGDSYNKYNLKFLNYSTKTGYERLFYKFRVKINKSSALSTLDQSARVYSISEFELSINDALESYECLQTYTYTGYCLGYDSESATESTLTCTVDGLEKYLNLDVYSTTYRPSGTNGTDLYTQDSISSVYFSVPNEIINEYGLLSEIHATWLNATLAPMLVTGNSDVYNALVGYQGNDIGYNNSDIGYTVCGGYSSGNEYGLPSAELAYNPIDNLEYSESSGEGWKRLLTKLCGIFYTDGADADTYTLSSAELLNYLQNYSLRRQILGIYSTDLFDSYDDCLTDVTIKSTDGYSITSQTWSQTWWEKWFGKVHNDSTNIYTLEALHAVTASDFLSSTKLTCDNLYIGESDYSSFKSFYDSATAKDETVFLFRFALDEYKSWEATEFSYKTTLGIQQKLDTNAYFFQESVYLDFDIIDLTFTKNNVQTIIPVVMSPIDIVGHATSPVITTTDSDKNNLLLKLLSVLLGLLVLLVIIVLAYPILVPLVQAIFKAVVYVLCIPIKLIGSLFKGEKGK